MVGGAARAATLGNARALLHRINFEEPFGLSVVEALACGTTVIACRRGSMHELKDDRENRFVVDMTAQEASATGQCTRITRRSSPVVAATTCPRAHAWGGGA